MEGLMKKVNKINIDVGTNRKLELICFFQGVSKKRFVEQLIEQHLEKNPLPKSITITDDCVLELKY